MSGATIPSVRVSGPCRSYPASPLLPPVHLSRSLILAPLAAALLAPASAHAQTGGQGPPAGTPLPPAPPTPELRVERPKGEPLIHEGQPTRALLGGTWYYRPDDTFVGEDLGWFRQRTLSGWQAVSVPHNWNATDTLENRSSIGWYRKEFKVPLGDDREKRENGLWKVRFEGSNYRTKVWLNGEEVTTNTGLFPFEADLSDVRKGRNTLTVEVSSLRSNTDLTHWRPAAFNGFGSGGWWNFGGLLREVYMRRVDTVDIGNVQVLPRQRKARGPVRVYVSAAVRNVTKAPRRVTLGLEADGEEYALDPVTVRAGRTEDVETSFTIKRPKLWQPGSPNLYDLKVTASVPPEPEPERGEGERQPSQREEAEPEPDLKAEYDVRFGVKRLEVRGGALLLNGRRLNLRGASIHEDDIKEGGALSEGTRRQMVGWLRKLHATVTRSHYPLHPSFIEAFDRYGILYWVDAPVYQLPNSFFPQVSGAATRAVTRTVRNNMNNASILAWSLANEPGGNRSELGAIGPGLDDYIESSSAAVREIDDTHLIAIDRQSRLEEPLTAPAYASLDVLGVNEYFGWYDSVRADVPRPPSTLDELGPYLDTLHAANPNLPLVITEFGAEASRDGPSTQPGSFQFQRRYVRDHLGVYASKDYIYGAIHWALRDFRVEPGWSGGAPAGWATPPWHNKSLIEEFDGRKPAYFTALRLWRKTRPLR